MDRRAFTLGGMAMLGLSACSSKFRTYNGPPVTSVVVNKGSRRMYLLHNAEVLKEYTVDLGFAPYGHKTTRGDGRTPEGTYRIDRRNPNSSFHLSVGIDYPNAIDVAQARAAGRNPGGDIFIHGEPNDRADRKRARKVKDWTAGCIAVRNREIEEIYAMVLTGTPVTLRA
ncbi:murein L,D-transpeptidase family protein [Cribrihabitans sp. XS_ASV171]